MHNLMTHHSAPTYQDLLNAQLTEQTFSVIGDILRSRTGFNISAYKDKCMKRRIAIRMRATCSATAEDYCRLITEDEAELNHLVRVLTIHVSQFFRNPPTFQKIREVVLPMLFAPRVQAEAPLRIWSVGCATGEEPYSLALILKEHFPDMLDCGEVSVLATDVDQEVLEQARKGVYGAERLADLPEPFKGKYFLEEAGKFELLQEIREMVEFRREDLNQVVDFPGADLILCRNVLIYFERRDQERIMHAFADALPPDGVLILGKSEILVGESRKRFDTLCPYERIYRKALI